MATRSSSSKPSLQIDKAANQKDGSTVKSVYVEREMKVYAIHEPELDSISFFNTASLTLFSAGSFALSVATNNGFNISILGDHATWLSILMFVLGGIALKIKTNIVSKIKAQSKTRQ